MKPKFSPVQNSFSKASSSYDNSAFIQKECARKLISALKTHFEYFHPHSILDLGTGTGCIPEILLDIFPTSTYSLNDVSADMLKKAKGKLANHKKIHFILGDMSVQDFNFHQLIISNMALQWVGDLKKTIKRFYENSDVFAFSCLLDGTFHEWSEIFTSLCLPVPTYSYPPKKELEEYLVSLAPKKYFFNSQDFTLEFENAIEFIRYLKNLGANQASHPIGLSDLKKLTRVYVSKITITYKVFFGILKR